MIRCLSLLTVLAGVLFGQTNYFIAAKSTSLSAAAEAVTVQQPATGSKSVSFIGGYAYCSAACTITLSVGGTAATTTALTPTSLTQPIATPVTAAFHTSNVGAGTTVAVYDIAAGGSLSLDLTKVNMTGNNTARNLTLKTDSITGTARLSIEWSE